MSNLKYIGKNVLNHTLEIKKGNVSGSVTSTGSFGKVEATSFSGDGANITGVTAEWDGTHTGNGVITGNFDVSGDVSGSGTGSFGLVEISGMDIDPTGVARDQVLKFNGTNFVPAAYNATFEFSISSFSMNHTSTPVLIGSGSLLHPTISKSSVVNNSNLVFITVFLSSVEWVS